MSKKIASSKPSPLLGKDAIRTRLAKFAEEYQNATHEKQEAQQFWNAFLQCYGLHGRKAALYENKRKRLNGSTGFIDCLVPGKILVEHKSFSKNLDDAKDQAISYAEVLESHEMPKLMITCDFQNWRVWDLDTQTEAHFTLAELPDHWERFLLLANYEHKESVEENKANRDAAYAISELHEALLQNNFTGKDLEVFLTRIVFCLFADDSHIFERNGALRELIEGSNPDGSDTGARLDELFSEALNLDPKHRQQNSSLNFENFTYINGDLFKERHRIPRFNESLREKLIACVVLDWSLISPAIFGAMFQGVLEHGDTDRKGARRELGAHYTSETNILRAINPLVMDDLRAEFKSCNINAVKLKAFHDKLATLTFLDPACGCGNFLVITYRELRRLEHDVIEKLYIKGKQGQLLATKDLITTNVSQFYGIEIDESAAHIARIALWITDHQMNLEAHKRFLGDTRPTVPIKSSPHILCANALQIDWENLLPSKQCHFIVGNPPFVGYSYQSRAQKADLEKVFEGLKGAGVLDYVSAWYVKAAHYLQKNTKVRAAFVSTNSITQGEQVSLLWRELSRLGVHIHFAHRTFKWNNEGKGIAAVHCVIIGFALHAPQNAVIFDYSEDVKGEPTCIEATRINPYLVDAPTVFLEKRKEPICNAPKMIKGSMPNDGGNLLLSDEEKNILIAKEPKAEKWIHPFLGAEEFIKNIPRWCLWLKGISAGELRAMPLVYQRVQAVKKMRQESPRAATQKLAETSTLFGEIRQTDKPYLLIPSVSSESRHFIPVGFLQPEVIASNLVFMLPNATHYHFGVLCSTMHNAWMRATCGRLKSDYRYSNTIVYNNYPWPEKITLAQQEKIETTAKAVLSAREKYPDSSLAALYDPIAMPEELVKAHRALDKAVDAAYGYKTASQGAGDAPRVAFLFALYQDIKSRPADATKEVEGAL